MTRGFLDDDNERRRYRGVEAINGRDKVELAVILLRTSDAAWFVSDTGERERGQWVPKSLCTLTPPVDPRATAHILAIPEWLAKEKGLL